MDGTIEKISNWKNGKGYFAVIDGQEYHGFGNPHAKAGDRVKFLADANKTLGDKDAQLIKEIVVVKTAEQEAPAVDYAAAQEAREKHMKEQKDREQKAVAWASRQQEQISRSVALKEAVNLEAQFTGNKDNPAVVEARILRRAELFKTYLMEGPTGPKEVAG